MVIIGVCDHVKLYIVYLRVCRSFASHSLPASHDEPEPSEQSFSDSLLSKFNAVSMRYSFTKTMCMQILYVVRLTHPMIFLMAKIQRINFKGHKGMEGEAVLS